MRNVFLDPALQASFDKTGYITAELMNETELTDLFDLLGQLKSNRENDKFTTDSSYKLSFFNADSGYRKKVLEEIGAFFQPKVDKILDNYVPLIINLFDKEPGPGEVPIHQNWTFVDEDKFTSVSVWIPLCEVSRENGTLEIYPGSHRVLTKYRSPTIPWVFREQLEVLKEKYLKPFEMKPGQVGIIDDSIIHWSSDNNSKKVRSTIQLIMIPKEATPIHYYNPEKGDSGELQVYKVDSEFFTTFNMNEKPKNVELIGNEPFENEVLTEERMEEKVQANLS